MAKLTGPLMSQNASGSIGARLTFSRRKTGQQARFQRAQKDKKSVGQLRNREVYFEAVGDWQALPVAEKEIYNKKAVGRGLTGFNLFVKDYYKNSMRQVALIENIDCEAVSEVPLFVIPAGLRFVLTSVMWTLKQWGAQEGAGTAHIGNSDNSFKFSDVVLSNSLVEGAYEIVLAPTSETPIFKILEAGDIVKLFIDSAPTGNPYIIDISVIGYFLEP